MFPEGANDLKESTVLNVLWRTKGLVELKWNKQTFTTGKELQNLFMDFNPTCLFGTLFAIHKKCIYKGANDLKESTVLNVLWRTKGLVELKWNKQTFTTGKELQNLFMDFNPTCLFGTLFAIHKKCIYKCRTKHETNFVSK
ncbi:hypothetical protein CEXT_451051 [Caerostris extrusa]|uniref:Uncharacterized protein n=1 Tax=Caerostris extrusa TaxID=172846 RepID=A0AAV4WT47_CAEEX|nr:hypothetical protein CEXT_451041 [Caerostris extrusa]GIY86093.1 hypothetical protein CEXT_451042 [Caerostris extrusa]GIY86095.1 hypothetical protein CEXT_451051 [Caerostris extrusa]